MISPKGFIFVTGGAGFIGSWVVRELLADGYGVRCLVRPSTDTRRIDGLPIEKVTGDIMNIDSLRLGVKGCVGIIHLAGLSSWKDITSPHMPKILIDGSLNVFEVAKENGNLKVVYISSITAIDGRDHPDLLNEESEFTLPNTKHFAYAYAKRAVETHPKKRSVKAR